MENSNDTIGNQTRYLPACSTVPQPTAPPRVVSMQFVIIPEVVATAWVSIIRKSQCYCLMVLPHDTGAPLLLSDGAAPRYWSSTVTV